MSELATGEVGSAGLVDRLALAPAATCAVALALMLGLYAGTGLAAGGASLLEDPRGIGRLNPGILFNGALALLFALTLWASLRELRWIGVDLDALRPVLRFSAPDYAELRRELRVLAHGTLPSLLLGGAVGLGIHAMGRRIAESQELSTWGSFHSTWNLVILVVLFATMGQRVQASLAAARRFSELGRRHTEVRLLAPESLAPYGRRGLRLASYWFAGSAVALLLFVSPENAVLVTAVIAVTFSLGILNLLLPCLGIHERLRQAKLEELGRVREAIEAHSAALLAGDAAETPDQPIASLIAYEARIEHVREWPLDTPTLGRFSLFLLIPLGSWLGGALVERLVDAALG